jgi:hypothetical protein
MSVTKDDIKTFAVFFIVGIISTLLIHHILS